jgi:hypothetical protein
MASASFPTLAIPLSPLVGGPGLSEDFFATLVAQGTLKPLPNLSFSSSSSESSQQSTAVPAAIPSVLPVPDQTKPLPALPSMHIAPRQIISVLDLLERMDNDMGKEVQRVRESIKEARTEIAEYRHERAVRQGDLQRRRARERRETKGVDDEFWLQV